MAWHGIGCDFFAFELNQLALFVFVYIHVPAILITMTATLEMHKDAMQLEKKR
jgi:hypothetical protein